MADLDRAGWEPGDSDADASTDADADERELRVLLERAVPQLPSPARRLEDVRMRVRRRRQRRAAGGAGLAVAAAAAAGLLAPSLTGATGPAQAVRPPASAPSVPPVTYPGTPGTPGTGPTSLTASPPPYPADGARARRFDALAGLTLDVPRGWYVLAPSGSSTVWLSTQSLALPQDGCAHPRDGFCTPLVRALGRGAVLVQVEVRIEPAFTLKSPQAAANVEAQKVLSACRAVGGTAQLGTTVLREADSAVAWAAACLARPGADARAAARALLTTADFT